MGNYVKNYSLQFKKIKMKKIIPFCIFFLLCFICNYVFAQNKTITLTSGDMNLFKNLTAEEQENLRVAINDSIDTYPAICALIFEPGSKLKFSIANNIVETDKRKYEIVMYLDPKFKQSKTIIANDNRNKLNLTINGKTVKFIQKSASIMINKKIDSSISGFIDGEYTITKQSKNFPSTIIVKKLQFINSIVVD